MLRNVLGVVILALLLAGAHGQPRVGFAFSGGGSRIAQEVAALEALMTGKFPGGKPIRPVFTSGTSAGSLCSIAVNALLQTMDGKLERPFTFETLKGMVFNMTIDTVIDITPLGLYRILTYNVGQGYILDSAPLRATMTKYAAMMGYTVMGDLYIPTCISVVDEQTGLPIRICSDNPEHRHLNIVDVLMASAALPVIFPTQQIPGFVPPFGGGVYVDGGVGIDMIPVDSAYGRGLDQLYIITRQWELNDAETLPKPIQDIKILAKAINTFSNLLQATFFSGLSSAWGARMPSYAYIPVLPVNFGVLDFHRGREMYEMTKNWTRYNAPICVNCKP